MSDSAEAAGGGLGADAEGTTAALQALVRVTDGGVVQFDAGGRVVAVDDALLELSGYDRRDLRGEHASALFDEPTGRRVERTVAVSPSTDDAHAEGRSLLTETTLQTATGGTVRCELEVEPLIVDGGGAIGVVRTDTTETATDEAAEIESPHREHRNHEGHHSSLIDNVPGMVYCCRNERGWPMEFVSDACEAITGYDAAALERGDVEWGEDVMLEEDREMVWETVQTETSPDGTFQETYRIETAEGETRWVSDSGSGIFADGELVAIEGIISDVTERERAQRQLAQERDMFAEGPAVVFRWVSDETAGWPVEYVSENVEDVLGYTPEELESGAIPYADLLLEEEIDRISREVEEASDGTTDRFRHEPYRVKTKDGGIRWVKDITKIVRDEDGEIVNYLGYLVDITERKEREQELEEYETIVETVNDGVYVVDEDGRFTMVNDAYVEMLGYDRDELIGEHVSTVVDEETVERAQDLESAIRDDATATPTIEAELQTADGDRLVSEATFALLPGPDGAERRVGVARDISDRKERERQLENSNERLEQFAYAASHDLQEPLRMVSSYLQLIEQRYAEDLDGDAREFLEYAVDGAERMRKMIQALLEYSRVETEGEPFAPVDLDVVLADVREDLQFRIDESGATIATDGLPRVRGDENQLRQVFQNLLENAIEYSGEDPPRIHVGDERAGSRWVLSVSDEGIGIDQTDHERVFEIFQRLHSREDHAGTGIGLSLCRRIVERHGGDIWIDSDGGDGTTVSFTVPAAE